MDFLERIASEQIESKPYVRPLINPVFSAGPSLAEDAEGDTFISGNENASRANSEVTEKAFSELEKEAEPHSVDSDIGSGEKRKSAAKEHEDSVSDFSDKKEIKEDNIDNSFFKEKLGVFDIGSGEKRKSAAKEHINLVPDIFGEKRRQHKKNKAEHKEDTADHFNEKKEDKSRALETAASNIKSFKEKESRNVKVHIGSITVKQPQKAAKTENVQRAPFTPSLSLDQYLKKRSGGRI